MNLSNFNLQQFNALSVLQFSTDDSDSLDYISGSKAIKENNVKVSEESESGSVNTLVVENFLDRLVFFSDGDILSGAKQNRILNISILLPAKSRSLVPVSCIERGRWSYRTSAFNYVNYHAYKDLRATKAKSVSDNLKKGKKFESNQRKVWQEVSNIYYDCFDSSPTDNLSDLYEKKSLDINEYIRHFQNVEGSNGIAFFINKRIQSVDIFGRNDIYIDYFQKLLKGIGLSALSLKTNNEKNLNLDGALSMVKSMLNDSSGKIEGKYNSIGLGETDIYESMNYTGFELSYNNALVHLALLNLQKT
jgi:hypothetical protein